MASFPSIQNCSEREEMANNENNIEELVHRIKQGCFLPAYQCETSHDTPHHSMATGPSAAQ
jgi:hypothetical protein